MSKVKTANRIIRPYLGIENFDNSLDGIQFKVNGELNTGKQYLNRSQFEDLRLSQLNSGLYLRLSRETPRRLVLT